MEVTDDVFMATMVTSAVCSLLIFAFLIWLKWSGKRKGRGSAPNADRDKSRGMVRPKKKRGRKR